MEKKARVRFGKLLVESVRESDGSVFQIRQDGHEFLVYRGTRLVVRHRIVRDALRTLASKGCSLTIADVTRLVRSDVHDAAFKAKIGGSGKGVAQVGHMMPLKRMARLNEREIFHTGQVDKGSFTVVGGAVRKQLPAPDNGKRGTDDTPYNADFDAKAAEYAPKGEIAEAGIKPETRVNPETLVETRGHESVPLRYWHGEIESVQSNVHPCTVVDGLHVTCKCS